MDRKDFSTAYFSMEFAFSDDMPNFAGGLGVLGADILFSSADLGRGVVGVSLIYHNDEDPTKGYDIAAHMTRLDATVRVPIEDREVSVALWEYRAVGHSGRSTPILFLSTNLPENQPWDRDLTKHLYANDRYTRLAQEAILGIGGVRALEAAGYSGVRTYHMNEGHSALLSMELLRRFDGDRAKVREVATFTNHTPILAGRDSFDQTLAENTLRGYNPQRLDGAGATGPLDMTTLALSMSRTNNSVSERHNAVCGKIFPGFPFENVTNGVYHPRWVGKHIARILDTHIPGWQSDPSLLRSAPERIPDEAIADARNRERADLVSWINEHPEFFPFSDVGSEDRFDTETLTMGFARRVVPYKRTALLFRDPDRLRDIAKKRLQVIYACRCSPGDSFCEDVRKRLAYYGNLLRRDIRVAIIPTHSLDIAGRMTSGCDLWLNNPVQPLEASGTSGMKSALNGGQNVSILDGWWIEADRIDPLAGWSFGQGGELADEAARDERDSRELLARIDEAIDCNARCSKTWDGRGKRAIALLAHFSTHRVVDEYSRKVWRDTR